MSPNQGQVWNLMTGGIGNPLIVNTSLSRHERQPGRRARPPTAPRAGSSWPSPPRPATPPQDPIYQGWLYAAVANPAGGFYGLFLTKDFGQNWTQVRIPTLPPSTSGTQSPRPSPPTTSRQPDYPILGGGGQLAAQGNYDLTLAVDPTNPNIVYLGGDRRRRPDRPDPHRHHRHLGRPLPGRLLQQRQRRRRARPRLHRPGHGQRRLQASPIRLRHRLDLRSTRPRT